MQDISDNEDISSFLFQTATLIVNNLSLLTMMMTWKLFPPKFPFCLMWAVDSGEAWAELLMSHHQLHLHHYHHTVIIIRIDIIDKQIRTGIIIIVVLHKSIATVTFRLREVIFQLTYSLYSGCRFWEILFQFTYSLSSKLSFREVIFKFKYSLYSAIRFRKVMSRLPKILNN